MQSLKIWTVLTVVWLCTFFTIERLHEPMNIASFVYVLTAFLSVIVLWLPGASQQMQLSLFAVSLVVLFVLKWFLGYPTWGAALPITVTEAVALGLTIFLCGRVNHSVDQFHWAALQIAASSDPAKAAEFDEGQVGIYRELRLARHFNRPLALMTISPQLQGNEFVLDRLVEEIYRKSARQFVASKVAESLLHATNGCATVLRRNDHLVVSMPEVGADRAHEVLAHVREVVREQLGIEISAGTASFPDEELTLTGLLDRAEAAMRETKRDIIPISTPQASPTLTRSLGS